MATGDFPFRITPTGYEPLVREIQVVNDNNEVVTLREPTVWDTMMGQVMVDYVNLFRAEREAPPARRSRYDIALDRPVTHG